MAKRKKNKLAWFIGGALALVFLSSSKQADTIIEIEDAYANGRLQRSTTEQYATRNLSQISQIVVHHSASSTHMAADFARWHVEDRGWPGMGYHFAIEKDGSIVMGNPLTNISYHTSGENTKSVGIVLSGNFNNEQPTPEQLESLDKLIAYLRQELPQPLEVYGHRDFKATSCPGANLYPLINDFKLAA